MKTITLILLLAVSRTFAADDTNLVAVGEWSQPVATVYGPAIRGRLLILDTPDHASSFKRTDTAVYLELQEFSSAIRSVRVYCGLHRLTLPEDAPGLKCELHDSSGKLIPYSPGGFSGSEPGSCWVTLMPYCSARLRVSAYGAACRLEDGGLHILLASRGAWDVHPNPTNDFYLSGTFTSPSLTKVDAKTGLPVMVDLNTGFPLEANPNPPTSYYSTNMDVWSGALTLPPVKIPFKKP
jgi:hypothetical protein